MANLLWARTRGTFDCLLGDGGVFRLDSTGAALVGVVATTKLGAPILSVQTTFDAIVLEGGNLTIAIAPTPPDKFPFPLQAFSGGVENLLMAVGGVAVLVAS